MNLFNCQKLLTLLFVFTLFSSCGDDKKEESTPKNHFTYDGESYELTKGYLTLLGSNFNIEGAYFDIVLSSSTLSLNQKTEELTGFGHVIYLDLNSSSVTELSSGTYTFDSEYFMSNFGLRSPNTFVDGLIVMNGDAKTGAGDIYSVYEETKGTVKVAKSDEQYVIEFSFTVESGKKVEGIYTGPLKFSDSTSMIDDESARLKRGILK
ncbi:hypothetical protein [Aureibacter tunicatorum]|uniref:Uncharacterized protein n=1 Tax=Aureibacter tunicatorum TaxID=866807 RepID=A0AAE4BQB1_9BACT|nr:hypothetical protein [Aureibacter tunicatorum]MDR6238899.1 hypothetical protein [Aureibacter tunicatorum]BDD05174.1 hypothetical protein AUTU_26570 [Aureibacter tunicatorum]